LKSTIKEEKQRQILSETYLNDNCMLVTYAEDFNICVLARYVENNSIRDTFIAKINENIKLKISDSKSHIGVFKDNELIRLYNAIENNVEYDEFSDIVYNNNFDDKVNIYKKLVRKKDE